MSLAAHRHRSSWSKYARPLLVSIAVTEAGEMVLLILYGVIWFPDGSMVHKALWALVFCGVGMGAVVGVLIANLIVDRFSATTSIALTVALFLLTLGIACNLLCLSLDRHFHYFGASSNPYLFSLGAVIGSLLGGVVVGSVLFTHKGIQLLERLGVKA